MTATGNEAVTLAQLRIAIGSTGSGSGSATGGEAVTIAQAAQALGVTSTGTPDVGGRAIRLSQLKTAVEAFSSVKIVPWSTGTDEQIAAMVAAADAGEIVLSDYWSAGDTRTVQLSAMPGSVANADESHAAQSVEFVLTDPGHYTLANGKPCSFVVLQKDCLNEGGAINSQKTNSGGWNSCPRRTWCNSVYRNAIPSSLRGIFKQFNVRTADGSSGSAVDSTDWFSLFSEKEIFGSTNYANASAEKKNTQLNYYKTSSNRIKRTNSSESSWWERSASSGTSNRFCRVLNDGTAGNNYTGAANGIAPFGCI